MIDFLIAYCALILILCLLVTLIICNELMTQKLFKITIRYSQLPLARKIARDYRLDYFNTTYNQELEQDQETVWFYVSAQPKKARAFLDEFNSLSNEPPKLLHVVVKALKT